MFKEDLSIVIAFINIIIAILAIVFYKKIENKKKINILWKMAVFLIVLISSLSIVVYGLIIPTFIYYFLWFLILLFLIVLITTMVNIFKKRNSSIMKIINISLVVAFILMIERIFSIDFTITYIIYILGCLLISIIYSIKNKFNILYVLSLILIFVGSSTLLVNKLILFYIICIIFEILLFIGIKKH